VVTTEPSSSKKKIIYVEPSSKDIDKFARDVCSAMAEKTNDPSFNKSEVIHGLSDFLRVVAKSQVNNLNRQLEEESQEK
jgi:hypothetical protein